jgi:DNA replication licensing factor MCM2
MTSVDQEKIAQLYAKLRRESLVTGSVPVTVRQIESMVRIAEAHARMHLRDFVNDDDINVAIQIVLQSFIDAQKYGIMRTMKKVFSSEKKPEQKNIDSFILGISTLFNV